jgi:DNA-binding transcriptional LysR family regulator
LRSTTRRTSAPSPAIRSAALALAGVGIALRAIWEVGHDLVEGRLVRVLPGHESSVDIRIYAVHPTTSLVPRAFALIDYLAERYRTPACYA